jgi:hypothetical protein
MPIGSITETKTYLNENQKEYGHKLVPIALQLAQVLKEKFNKEPTFSLEYSPDWLTTIPRKEEIIGFWELIQDVYSTLIDDKYKLEKQIELTKKNGNQHFDIWFHEPYSFAVEFDESQHFNQFRLRTLSFYSKFPCAFNLINYKTLNQAFKRPGKSGFQKLKNYDPLFPPMHEGENQDNRIRQRAFRDFMKDLLPITRGLNPTIRIPYQIVNNKKTCFNNFDLEIIEQYIINNELLAKITVP